jgi:hypothetical protein
MKIESAASEFQAMDILTYDEETQQSCRSLAEILGPQVHRANCNGAFYFPGGDIRLFVPEAATMEHLRAAAEFIHLLCTAMDGADCGGT